MTSGKYTEDTLVEQPAIRLLEGLGWETANCFDETFSPGGGSEGRVTNSEVILTKRLRSALERFNPGLPNETHNPTLEWGLAHLIEERLDVSDLKIAIPEKKL